MFGFSVFMNEDLDQVKADYISKMVKMGFTGIFTSMHIPEDDIALYKQRLAALGKLAKHNQLDLMVDVSGTALEKAGFDLQDMTALTALGVTGLRMDYHISNEQIARWSKQLTVSLNASTLTQEDLTELAFYQADFSQIEAWHNYYPRPETGLDEDWFIKKNTWLRQQGLTVQAFVSGDGKYRGPLYQGLPTLEVHRYQHPLASALSLRQMFVDKIYIGDETITAETQAQFLVYQTDHCLQLEVEDIGSAYYMYVIGKHTNRLDDARDVLRSADARFKNIPHISPEVQQLRTKGSVTIDNALYLRYMGEIQVTKRDLPSDDKVNVVGKIKEKDIALLPFVEAGMHFELVSRKEKNNERN